MYYILYTRVYIITLYMLGKHVFSMFAMPTLPVWFRDAGKYDEPASGIIYYVIIDYTV